MKVATITCQASLSSHWSDFLRRLLLSLYSSKLSKTSLKSAPRYLVQMAAFMLGLKKYIHVLKVTPRSKILNSKFEKVLDCACAGRTQPAGAGAQAQVARPAPTLPRLPSRYQLTFHQSQRSLPPRDLLGQSEASVLLCCSWLSRRRGGEGSSIAAS